MRLALVGLLLFAAACPKPAPANGTVRCSARGECPDGYQCAADNTCWTVLPDLSVATIPDAATGDLACSAPTSVADCDDHEPCTTDALTGSGCSATCTHTPIANGSGCGMGDGGAGVCSNGVCCMGCIKNGVCLPGNSDAKNCGSGGNDCFDCTKNSAGATCNGGQCSGCDATSCTTDGRTCGTSSCGFNCGGCSDSCANGALTHYACVNKSCQMNGGGNCSPYATCASSSTCSTSCNGDGDCVSTSWCDVSVHACKPKQPLGGACSAETTGDHECQSPLVCSWRDDAKSGYCVSARCTGCAAASSSGQCNAYIKLGLDPRGACQSYAATPCHQNYCAGTYYGDTTPPACDVGADDQGNARPCGAITCTNTSGGTGTIKGYLCVNGSCQPNQMAVCADAYQGCFACNANGCDESKYNLTCM